MRFSIALVALCLTCSASYASSQTGSGVIIDPNGDVLTAAHVVKGCSTLKVILPLQSGVAATVLASDTQNDLALVHMSKPTRDFVAVRFGAHVGENIVVAGYPLSGLLSSQINTTTGIISAAAGIGDDVRYFQISAPVQPGNSGGPVLDRNGNLVGLVAAKLDYRVALLTGALPENVNFAIKSDMAIIFLNTIGVKLGPPSYNHQLSAVDLIEQAKKFTVQIFCETGRIASRKPNSDRPQAPAAETKDRDRWLKRVHPDWFSNHH